MREQLVGYLLDCLDEGTQREVQSHLEADPQARRELARLRQAVEPLACDRGDPEPPADLAARTLARVAEDDARAPVLPRAPRSPRAFTGDRPFWRRPDLLVAASLLLLVGGLTTLAVFHIRKSALLVGCQDNLREFHGGLQAYHSVHGQYPNVAAQQGRAVAGMAVPVLINAGCLPRDANVRCPEIGPASICPLTFDQVMALTDEEFARQAPRLVNCYAYDLGHRDEQGKYVGPRDPHQRPKATVPLMADRPGADARSGNSPNHRGLGQNVLFYDGHVVFLKTRIVGDNDDFYLNRVFRQQAGLDELDSVLGASESRP